MDNEERVGYFTRLNLRHAADGVLLVQDFEMKLRTEKRFNPQNANNYLSLQETLAILRAQDGTEQTPRELMALMRGYQADIADIESNPRKWTNSHLTPERARAWYEQQIEAIRQQLGVNV